MKKNILRSALITGAVLLVPFLGMQFSAEVQWTFFDFVLMGALIFATGLAYEVVADKGGNAVYRLAVAVAFLTVFLLAWVNGAVGIIGSEDNPANVLYLGVIVVLGVGAAVAKLQAKKMVHALFVTAIATAFVPITAFIIWRPDFAPGVLQVFVLNTFFVGMFAASGLLFRRASQS